MTIDYDWLVTVINCQKWVLIMINNLLIIINNLLIIIKNWWHMCIKEIELCLWPWISWSILYQIQKLMTVSESSRQANLKIWWKYSELNFGYAENFWLRLYKWIQITDSATETPQWIVHHENANYRWQLHIAFVWETETFK